MDASIRRGILAAAISLTALNAAGQGGGTPAQGGGTPAQAESPIPAIQAIMREKRYDEAVSRLAEIIAKEPSNSLAYWLRAVSYRNLKRHENAIADVKKHIELGPRDPFFAHAYLAQSEWEAGDRQAALASLEKALSLTKEQGRLNSASIELAGWRSSLGDEAGAFEACRRPLETGEHIGLRLCAGRALLALRRWAQAEELLAKAQPGPKDAVEVHLLRASALIRLGRFAAARAHLDAAFELQPGLSPKDGLRRELAMLQHYQKAGLVNEMEPLPSEPELAPAEPPAAFDLDNEGAAAAREEKAPIPAPPAAAGPTAKTAKPAPGKPRGGGRDPLRTLAKDDSPWTPASPEKVEVSAEAAPLDLQSPLDINALTLGQYRRVAAAAREAMSLLQGPLNKEEAALLDKKWSSLADFPTEESVAYLNRLNPLLAELLSLRGVIASTAEEFDGAWLEGTTAAGYGNAAGAREAFSIAAALKDSLRAMNARLAGLLSRLEALGAPPDLAEAKGRAAGRHDALLDDVKTLVRAAKAAGAESRRAAGSETSSSGVSASTAAAAAREPEKGVWVLRRVERRQFARNTQPQVASDELKEGRQTFERTGWEPPMRGKLAILWEPVPGTIEDGEFRRKASVELSGASDFYSHAEVRLGTSRKGPVEFRKRIADLREPDQCSIYGFSAENEGGGGPVFDGHVRPPYPKGTKDVLLTAKFPTPYPGRLFEVHTWSVIWESDGVHYGNCRSRMDRVYTYEYFSGGAPKPATEEPTGDEAGDEEAAAFHESNVAILEKNLSRELEELGRTTDQGRREALEFRVLTVRADIQAEKDLAESIRTGEIVHTRTEFDDYLRDQFIANIRANQLRMEEAQRRYAEAQRLAALLPDGEAEDARKFIERQLTPAVVAKGDLSAIAQVSSALGQKVLGYAEGAKARGDLASAERALFWLGGVQAAGNVAASIVFGQKGGAVYAGVTGYISGGTEDAVRGAAMVYSWPTSAAVEAYEGYQKGGLLAPAGVLGAIERGAEAALMTKFFEYGLSKAGSAFSPLNKPADRESLRRRLAEFRAQEGLRGPSGLDPAQFRKEMAKGRELVDDLVRMEKELAAGRKAAASAKKAADPFDDMKGFEGSELGGRGAGGKRSGAFDALDDELAKRRGPPPPSKEQLAELERRVEAKAAELNASFHAKNYLKNAGGEAEKLASARIEKIYKKVDAAFRQNLERAGWDTRYLKIKEFRNASSKGKIGMDRDFGVVEDEVTLYVKNGKGSSVGQLQKDGQTAYKEAYERITGQSYEKSFQEFTTRAHSEAFRDVGVLSDLRRPENVAKLKSMWGEQTARTIEFKGMHMLNDPKLSGHLSQIERYMETSRGLGKEIEKKLIPFLQNARPAPGLDAGRIREAEKHFTGLKTILDDLTSYRIDPMEASRRIRVHTGGKDLPQVLDQVRNVGESLFKFGALGR